MSGVKRYYWHSQRRDIFFYDGVLTEDREGPEDTELVLASDVDALAQQLAASQARVADLEKGFYQLVKDADLKKIEVFLGDGDLPTKSFFMRPDAAYLANVSMHMVREVQAVRNRIAARDKRLAEAEGLLREWGDMSKGGLAASALGNLRIKNAAFLSPAEDKSND